MWAGRWKRVLLALAPLTLAFAVTSWLVEGVTPTWIVFPVFVLLGLVRARRGGTSDTVWLGVGAFIFLLVHIPFDRAALSDRCVNPGDAHKDCHPLFWLVSLGAVPLLTVVAAVLAFREAGGVWRLPLRRP